MMTTLEKIKRLERYVGVDNSAIDPVLDMTLEKLIRRELNRLLTLKSRLVEQVSGFENKYSLTSEQFYLRYEQGEMGDDIDFIEWSATLEMIATLEQQADLLVKEPVQ
ncbi:MAG: hypothetical protein NT075_13795 [Chloroflexi bacterium]|nr:hypothetical protein [Chloroflexota bacterium]